ncbi:hypothetical protein [Fibrobacter sp.]|uniref:hypothetical protein n=1 Tax=Fibrobacter sp. TaxID=35828 RepID=UPI0038905635
MAKNRANAAGKVADAATESARMRMLRIDGSQNGATLRTRVVRDKTKYNRNLKHKKSLADAGDFPFMEMSVIFSKVYKFCKHLFARLSLRLPTFICAGECR